MKSLEPTKNFKKQPRPLVRPSSVNFCHNFLNLSHETVPLSYKVLKNVSHLQYFISGAPACMRGFRVKCVNNITKYT
jgi:hypothetical protein